MSRLRVYLGETAVAEVWRDGRDRFGLQLLRSYLDQPSRPVLGQWFEDRLERRHASGRALHPWFTNLLPEPETAMRRLVARAAGLAPSDTVGLLRTLGEQLPGKVVVRASAEGPPLPRLHVGDPAEEIPPGLRGSLGGVQLKLTLSGEDHLILGVRDEAFQWILKLAAQYPKLPFNESAIMSWCAATGFDVPEHRVVHRDELPDLGDVSTELQHGFLIRRYDRTATGRIHQEDFAQVFNCEPASKYSRTDSAGLGSMIGQVLGVDGIREFIRRLTVVVATGNADAHLKNWSLLYQDPQRPRLAPLYDQVATIEFPSLDQRLAMRIGHAQHLHQVSMAHFDAMAERWSRRARPFDDWAKVEVQPLVERTLVQMRGAFRPEFLGMQPALATRLREHWRSVPLLRPFLLP